MSAGEGGGGVSQMLMLQGPPSQTVVFYFVHVYTYIDWGYYLGIYSFQYPCTILAIKEIFLNFDSIYPIWGTFGSSPIFTILPNFHHIVDRINTFFWNYGQQNHKKRPNLKKRLFWSLKSYNLSKKLSFGDVWAILWPFF